MELEVFVGLVLFTGENLKLGPHCNVLCCNIFLTQVWLCCFGVLRGCAVRHFAILQVSLVEIVASMICELVIHVFRFHFLKRKTGYFGKKAYY